MKRLSPLLLALILSLTACSSQSLETLGAILDSLPSGSVSASAPDSSLPPEGGASSAAGSQTDPAGSAQDPAGSGVNPAEPELPDEDGYYYDLENVVLYLEAYDALPSNFITKAEARQLGWTGGSVEDYLEGAAIGGDTFGNREGLLPKESDRRYTECDLNTNGQDSRGAERLVFSNDGLYFHPKDHYESFQQVTVEDGEVFYASTGTAVG